MEDESCAVTTSLQLHPECPTAKMYCVEGGKHCNAEMFARAEKGQKEMAQMEPERTVRPPLLWLSFQELEEDISEMAKEVGHVEGVEDKKATSHLRP